MRRLVFSAVILLLLLWGSLLSAQTVEQLGQDYIRQLEHSQQLARQGNWNEASRVTRQTYEGWNRHSVLLHALLRHSETDRIRQSFQTVEQCLLLRQWEQYCLENTLLIAQLQQVIQTEQPSAENIL